MKALREIRLKKALKFGLVTILMIPYKVMIFPQLRVLYLRLLGAKIGKDVIIHNVKFFNYYRTGFRGLTIGNDCFIGDETLIDLADKVVVSDSVTVAERVTILTHTNVGYRNHPLQKYFPPHAQSVTLEYGSFIGTNATILPGVRTGKCTFVAAGSVVTKNIPPYSMVGGVPARLIKTIK